jgi:hypothetical protein
MTSLQLPTRCVFCRVVSCTRCCARVNTNCDQQGMRHTITSDTVVKGLPGVGTYDVTGYDLAAQSAVKYAAHGKALYHARAAAAKRSYG